MKIKQLSQSTINKIAAGEVVERPASVIKELLENSIDAGANFIEISTKGGGRDFISIFDNGSGIGKDDLEIAILAHTTSKLDESDINNITFFGFRGEALSSIASVSKISITSKTNEEEMHGWNLSAIGGEIQNIEPAPCEKGTKIIVQDLFFSTPARLKFLKSEKLENNFIIETVKKLAIANIHVDFVLKMDDKIIFDTRNKIHGYEDEFKLRVSTILGKNFIDNSCMLSSGSEDHISIKGLISLPTYNKGTSSEIYIYVNNRPVFDKLLLTSIRVAYQDVLAPARFPVVVIFLKISPYDVDVNVHPTKAEVRFSDPHEVKSFIISVIRDNIREIGTRSSSVISSQILQSFKDTNNTPIYQQNIENKINPSMFSRESLYFSPTTTRENPVFTEDNKIEEIKTTPPQPEIPEETTNNNDTKFELGIAKSQLHENYIISQTEDSIIIVDQHAAHERILYEKLKKDYYSAEASITQRLLIPAIIELNEDQIERIMAIEKDLKKLGLHMEKFGYGQLKVTEIPKLISSQDVDQLIRDIVDDLIEHDENISFTQIINDILSTFACHHSVRRGRKLNESEMNALLRQMENEKLSGQCNHGRPTFVKLKLKDIDRLFGR